MSSYGIRPLRPGEHAACERILRSLPEWFGIESAIVDYVRDLQKMETWVIAPEEGAPVGFLTLHDHGPDAAEIHVMALEPALRGQGWGRRLVDHAERELRQRSVRFLHVKTLAPSRPNEHYEKTRGFYRRLGFVPLEENELWGRANPCLMMVKHLGSAADAPDGGSEHLSARAHRQLIGYLGLFLPLILIVLAYARPTPGIPADAPLESLSAYYYTGAVAAFTGILFSLSLFLFTYRGYRNYRADRIAGAIGGAAALGVALFPTVAPGSLSEPSWWIPVFRVLHYTSAAVLFLVFIVFALWLFRKSNVPPGAPLPPGKAVRNRLFLGCGLVMIAGVIWAGVAGWKRAPIFWAEAVAIWAFAVSWLAKGRATATIADAAQRVMGRRGAAPRT